METSTTKLILEITKKLREYQEEYKHLAETEQEEYFEGKSDAFKQAIDIVAEISKSLEVK